MSCSSLLLLAWTWARRLLRLSYTIRSLQVSEGVIDAGVVSTKSSSCRDFAGQEVYVWLRGVRNQSVKATFTPLLLSQSQRLIEKSIEPSASLSRPVTKFCGLYSPILSRTSRTGAQMSLCISNSRKKIFIVDNFCIIISVDLSRASCQKIYTQKKKYDRNLMVLQEPRNFTKSICMVAMNIVYWWCIGQYLIALKSSSLTNHIVSTVVCLILCQAYFLYSVYSAPSTTSSSFLSKLSNQHAIVHLFMLYFSFVIGNSLLMSDEKSSLTLTSIKFSVYLIDFSYMCCVLALPSLGTNNSKEIVCGLLEENWKWGAGVLVGVTIGTSVHWVLYGGFSNFMLAICALFLIGFIGISQFLSQAWVVDAFRNSHKC